MKRGTQISAILVIALFNLVYFSSCKEKEKTPDPVPFNPWDTVTNFSGMLIPTTGSMQIQINYLYDGKPIVFGSKYYSNMAGDTFTINELRHYLSNVTLSKVGGGEINLGNYQLLNAKEGNPQTFTIANVPAGNYIKLSCLLGVDSMKNHNGLQEGALDPAYGMFWTWSTGYIFFRINGNTTTSTNYSFDLGGDENAAEEKVDLNSFKVKSNMPKLELDMEISEMFKNPQVYSFKTDGYAIHSGVEPPAYKLAANMKDLVSIKTLLP